MSVFIILIIIIQILTCIYKPVWGLGFYLFIRIVIPPIARAILVGTSLNTFCLFIIIASIIIRHFFIQRQYLKKSDYNYIVVFICSLSLLGLVANLPYTIQFRNFSQFIITEILPYFPILYMIKNEKDLKIVINILLVSFIIVGIYGIFTYIVKFSPAYTLFSLYFETDVDFTNQVDRIRGGLEGAAVGNLSGPLPWGQLVLLIFSFFALNKQIKVSYLTNICLIITFANCMLCGKRSIIIPSLLICSFIFLRVLKSKFGIIYIATITIIGIIAINKLPELKSYKQNIETAIFFWDDKLAQKNDIGGSSTSMRQEQLTFSIKMIENYPLQGLGLNYPEYYNKTHGLHPKMLGFESIIFYVLISSGLIGVYIWFFFLRGYYKAITRNKHKSNLVEILFISSYILSLLLTSIQSSFFMFMILGALFIKMNEFIPKQIKND